MKCKDQKKLSAWLDGELDSKQRQEIATHLQECAECRRLAEELAAVSETMEALEGLEPSPYFTLGIKQKVANLKPSGRTGWRRILIPTIATAAGILSIFLGGYLGQVIYAGWTDETTLNETEVAEYLGSSPVQDFPEGSLGEVFDDMFNNGGNS